MLLISTLYEGILSLCESLIVLFFYTITLDKKLISNNFKELVRYNSYVIDKLKLKLNPNTIKLKIEKLILEKQNENITWRKRKNNAQIQIIIFSTLLLLATHVLIYVFFLNIKSSPFPMIIRNTLLVLVGMCTEILFVRLILNYRFI